jgi:hypothetical protein
MITKNQFGNGVLSILAVMPPTVATLGKLKIYIKYNALIFNVANVANELPLDLCSAVHLALPMLPPPRRGQHWQRYGSPNWLRADAFRYLRGGWVKSLQTSYGADPLHPHAQILFPGKS